MAGVEPDIMRLHQFAKGCSLMQVVANAPHAVEHDGRLWSANSSRWRKRDIRLVYPSRLEFLPCATGVVCHRLEVIKQPRREVDVLSALAGVKADFLAVDIVNDARGARGIEQIAQHRALHRHRAGNLVENIPVDTGELQNEIFPV